MTSWAMPSGRSLVWRPATRRRSAASTNTMPRAKRHAVGARHVDRVALAEPARRPRRRRPAAGWSPARRAPAAPRRRRSPARRRGWRRRSTACGPAACGVRLERGADRVRSAMAPASTPGRERVGDHRADARPRRDAGRLQLARHPAAPPAALPLRPARIASSGSSAAHSADQRASSGRPWGRRCTARRGRSAARSPSAPTLCATSAAMRSLSP